MTEPRSHVARADRLRTRPRPVLWIKPPGAVRGVQQAQLWWRAIGVTWTHRSKQPAGGRATTGRAAIFDARSASKFCRVRCGPPSAFRASRRPGTGSCGHPSCRATWRGSSRMDRGDGAGALSTPSSGVACARRRSRALAAALRPAPRAWCVDHYRPRRRASPARTPRLAARADRIGHRVAGRCSRLRNDRSSKRPRVTASRFDGGFTAVPGGERRLFAMPTLLRPASASGMPAP
jgi:hypothetical protein